MYAALIRASQTWKRIVISDFELKQIEELREELDAEFNERAGPAKTSASHRHLSSRGET
ncbi:MAG: hypothetical protein ACREV9_12240 [Burkholderiales bacterium]